MKEILTSESCVTCGVCCVAPHDQDVFCDVTPKDEMRLGRRFVRLHVLRTHPFDTFAAAIDGREVPYGAIKTKWATQRTGPFKGIDILTCVALRGSVHSCVSCYVYERRPDACRKAVKPGDKLCRQWRAMFAEQIEALQEGSSP